MGSLWRRGCAATEGIKRGAALALCSASLGLGGCGAADLSPTSSTQGLSTAPPRACEQLEGEEVFDAPIEVIHEDEMGASFALERVAYALDGVPFFEWEAGDDPVATGRPETLEVLDRRLLSGAHELLIHVEYRSVGWGVGYVRSYTFRIQSRHEFDVEDRCPRRLVVSTYERGGVTTPLEERPAVRFTWSDREGS